MDNENDMSLESRPPTLEDLVELCKNLNENRVAYIVVGGMAVIQHGFIRATEDIDLLVDISGDNEKRIQKALLYLPDQAVNELEDNDIKNYTVVRIADEIVIDLMKSACGIEYKEASNSIILVNISGITIPFANLELLLKMKQTLREKDLLDKKFLSEKLSNLRRNK